MSSDSEPEQYSSGSESFTDFEEEIEGLVDAAVIDDNAEIQIDRPYMGEPLADENWLRDYNSRREEEKQQNELLLRRLDGTFSVESWCTCGHCHVERLANAKEFKCCRELEQVPICLNEERVYDDVEEIPQCITQHPGFSEVCLGKWSLRHLADKYRTKDNVKYRRTGTENGFFRAVAYREFTRLVHGRLGNNKRIPLPACAYHKIRTRFPGTELKGFEDEDEL